MWPDPPAVYPDGDLSVPVHSPQCGSSHLRPRYLLGRAIIAVGIFAVFTLGKEWLTDDPPMPAEWLTEADQDALADATTMVDVECWTAACTREQRNPRGIVDVVDHPDGKVSASEWKTRTGRKVSTLVLGEVLAGRGDYDEVEAPGVSCRVRPGQ